MSNQIFHFSNTGISSGQRFYLKDDVSGIFLRNLNIDSNFPVVASNLIYNTGNQTISGTKTFVNNIDVSGTGIFNAIDLNNIDNLSLSGVDVAINSSRNLSVTNSNVTFSGNNINFENQNNINLAYQFPAWTGIRRYPPADLFSVSSQLVLTGTINYFPFLIKKKVVNPIACVDMSLYSTFDPKIVIGIYSGHYGFENARLITSGSITGNILNTGIYRTTLNGTFDQGPYILASMLETGAGSQFRIVGSHGFREHFGINTGVNILHGLNSATLTNILAETGQVNLKTNIGSGSWFVTAASVVSPVVFLEY